MPAAAVPGLELPAGFDRALATITELYLRRVVATIAADRFAGRGPGSRGDVAARRWLADALGTLGYRPGMAGGGFEQPFPIVGITATMPATWTFTAGTDRTEVLRWSDDFIAASGVQQRHVAVRDAEVVFVGYGIVAPEERWDDFAGADVDGKVLLMLNDDPSWDPALFAGERKLYYGRWTYKYESAARRGAAGAIIIHTTPSAGYPWSVVQSSWSGTQFELPAGDEPRTPVLGWVTEPAARRLVSLGGHDLAELRQRARRRDFRPVPLGVATGLEFDCQIERTETANVLGVLPGADRSLAHTAIVLSAHHDHLGVGEPDASGDSIYNGARDNGLAIAEALAVARAFTALPERPRRSVLALFVGGEEQGLLGSKYYAAHPTISPQHLAANINFELGNLWGRTRDVVVHGKGKNSLEALLDAAARHQGRVLRDEADPRAGWYYRSDQLSFARIGVPSIWFESGRDYLGRPPGWGDRQLERWIAERYHEPSDELDDTWRFDGAVEDAKLAFLVALAVATTTQPPTWTPGDEFASLRE